MLYFIVEPGHRFPGENIGPVQGHRVHLNCRIASPRTPNIPPNLSIRELFLILSKWNLKKIFLWSMKILLESTTPALDLLLYFTILIMVLTWNDIK